MSFIKIESNPTRERLEAMGVFDWPIWTKEESEFPWTYQETETCYLLEGEVEVIPDSGDSVHFGKGDLVTFPAGMSCHWRITRAVRKHYTFG
jgi:uncharacterized cupin superfamily protein